MNDARFSVLNIATEGFEASVIYQRTFIRSVGSAMWIQVAAASPPGPPQTTTSKVSMVREPLHQIIMRRLRAHAAGKHDAA